MNTPSRSTWPPGRAALLQLTRFYSVGLVCFVFNLLALAALCEVGGLNYVVAYVAVFLLGNALGYWLNGRFTFASRSRLGSAAMARYLLVNCVMLALGTMSLHWLVETHQVGYLSATALIAVLSAPITFAAHRALSYRSDAT